MPSTIPGGIICSIFTILLLSIINVKSSANALSQPLEGTTSAFSPPQFLFPRNLRVPFQHKNSQMMTARGFGKRSFLDYNDDGWEVSLLDRLLGQQQHQMHVEEVDTKRSPHIMEIREPRLRFRLADDGNLRIGRGFGKRSVQMGDGQKEECTCILFGIMKYFHFMNL